MSRLRLRYTQDLRADSKLGKNSFEIPLMLLTKICGLSLVAVEDNSSLANLLHAQMVPERRFRFSASSSVGTLPCEVFRRS